MYGGLLSTLNDALAIARADKVSRFASATAQGTVPTIFPLLRVNIAAHDGTHADTEGRGVVGGEESNILVALPMPRSQAEALMATATEEPTRMRRIDAQRLVFDNHEWEQAITRLVNEQVRTGLGLVDHPIRADINSLLICGTGGHRVRHPAVQTRRNVFGKLIVSLPSTHEGGTLVVSHNGKQNQFCTATNHPSKFRWCAFFSCVEQELLPVETGYRVVLVYDLVHTGTGRAPKPPPVLSRGARALKKWAKTWLDDKDAGYSVIATLLRGNYGADGPDFDCLEGSDLAMVNALRASGAFDLQIVGMQYSKRGDSSYTYTGIEEGMDCEFLCEYGLLDPDSWLPDDVYESRIGQDDVLEWSLEGAFDSYFQDRAPDEEYREDDYAYSTISYTYNVGAVVLRLKQHRMSALSYNTFPNVLLGACRGIADLHYGYRTPQAMYNAKVVQEGIDTWIHNLRESSLNDMLLALGHRHRRLSENCARSFVSQLRTSKLSMKLVTGLRALISLYAQSDWLYAALKRIFAGCFPEYSLTKVCFELIAELLAASPEYTPPKWVRTLATGFVTSLVASLRLRQPARSDAKATVILTWRSLVLVSFDPTFTTLVGEASRNIVENKARFNPLGCVAMAVGTLGFPQPPNAVGFVQNNAAAQATGGNNRDAAVRNAKDSFIRALVNSVVTFVAGSQGKLDCPTDSALNVFRCAIEANALETWAPFEKRFHARTLLAVLEQLSQESHHSLEHAGALWAASFRDILSSFSLESSDNTSRLFAVAVALDISSTDQFAVAPGFVTSLIAKWEEKRRKTNPWQYCQFLDEHTHNLGSALSGCQKRSPAFLTLLRYCTSKITPLASEAPQLDDSLNDIAQKTRALYNNRCPEVQHFFGSYDGNTVLFGQPFTYNGSETSQLAALAEQTQLFSIERLSSKAAYKNGKLRVNKGAAWRKLDHARSQLQSRISKVNAAKRNLANVSRLLQSAVATKKKKPSTTLSRDQKRHRP